MTTTPLPDVGELTVGTFNIERFGFDQDSGHIRLPDALDWMLEQQPVPPDILSLPEATHGHNHAQSAIRRTARYLSRHLDGHYEPLFSSQLIPGRRHTLALVMVNTDVAEPTDWFDPGLPQPHRHAGFAICEIYGHKIHVATEHWNGGSGRGAFDEAACRIINKGNKRKLLAMGDYNSDSGWEKELHLVNKLNWWKQCDRQDNLDKLEQKGWFNPDGVNPVDGEPGWEYPHSKSGRRGWWEIDTRAMDKLLKNGGFVDMGQEADDPTPTTAPQIGSGLRIDRIIRSVGFPGRCTKYSVFQPPRALSDHAYVTGTYMIEHAEDVGPFRW